MKSKTRERISAEGLLVVLEQLSGVALSQKKHKKGFIADHLDIAGAITGEGADLRVEGIAEALFALTHPWVEIHTNNGICGNSDDAHEVEYKQMLKIAKKLLENRTAMIEEEEED